MMHGREKSDLAIVAMKPANKANEPTAEASTGANAAEPVERRAGAEGNQHQNSTHWTQSQARVSQALERIRQAMAVIHPRWEPYAGKPPVRFCAGGAMKSASLPLQRREFITLLGGAAATWPLAARAQQAARVPRIGIVDDAPMWHSFRQALREFGYVEGQSINYEYRYSEGVPDRLAAVVSELVRRPVDLIAAYGTPPIEAAKAATTTIPIVMI